ncbi:hypothetical protein [Kitasatospora sp. NPDC047058]|uniref:hypothetical protein n=1 Tax=Kitasatospora sp. NPDC047058 TaxID=3155620 RepID=UPI0033EFBD1E
MAAVSEGCPAPQGAAPGEAPVSAGLPASARSPLPAWAGVLLALAVPLPVVTGGLLFAHWAPAVRGAALQLAGSRAAAEAVVGGQAAAYRAALAADPWLLGGPSAPD